MSNLQSIYYGFLSVATFACRSLNIKKTFYLDKKETKTINSNIKTYDRNVDKFICNFLFKALV